MVDADVATIRDFRHGACVGTFLKAGRSAICDAAKTESRSQTIPNPEL